MIDQRGGKQLINYDNDLPGPVCYTISESVDAIISTVNSGWVIDQKYKDRRLKFFKYIDDNNSKKSINQSYQN